MWFVGVSRETTVCDGCGKRGLAKTVVFELSDGEFRHYGVTCAARHTGASIGALIRMRREFERQSAWLAEQDPEVTAAADAYERRVRVAEAQWPEAERRRDAAARKAYAAFVKAADQERRRVRDGHVSRLARALAMASAAAAGARAGASRVRD